MNQANSPELSGRHFQNESIFTNHNLVFDHHDLNETCRNVGQIFKPHDLKISQQKRDFSATMHMLKQLHCLLVVWNMARMSLLNQITLITFT